MLLSIMSCGRSPKAIYTEADLIRLESEASKIDKLGNVCARKYYETYMQLGEAYYQFEQYSLSLDALKKGLRLNARDYKYQLLAAKTENKLGLNESSLLRLEQVIAYSESEDQITEATKLKAQLNKKNIFIVERNIPDMYDFYIYLLSVGEVDDIYIEAIKNKIEQEFHISIKSLTKQTEPDKEGVRDNPTYYFANVVDDFIERNGRARYDQIIQYLKEHNFIKNGDDSKEQFVHYLYLQEDNGENLWQKTIQSLQDQYNAESILKKIRLDYSDILKEKNCLGILAVTHFDLYANNYNFLFGLNSSDVAVMSYNRFINGEVTKSTKIKRAVMQAMSSAGFLVGIPRCTVAKCSRAYPHSLREHDAKNDILCEECKKNLIKLYESM